MYWKKVGGQELVKEMTLTYWHVTSGPDPGHPLPPILSNLDGWNLRAEKHVVFRYHYFLGEPHRCAIISCTAEHIECSNALWHPNFHLPSCMCPEKCARCFVHVSEATVEVLYDVEICVRACMCRIATCSAGYKFAIVHAHQSGLYIILRFDLCILTDNVYLLLNWFMRMHLSACGPFYCVSVVILCHFSILLHFHAWTTAKTGNIWRKLRKGDTSISIPE